MPSCDLTLSSTVLSTLEEISSLHKAVPGVYPAQTITAVAYFFNLRPFGRKVDAVNVRSAKPRTPFQPSLSGTIALFGRRHMSHLASDCLARLKMPSSAVLNFVSGARSNRFAVYCAYSSHSREMQRSSTHPSIFNLLGFRFQHAFSL